jgi:hypothetical protein
MADAIQVKRGLAASLPTLKVGELGFSTDTKQVHIGDGVTNHEITKSYVPLSTSGDLTIPTGNALVVGDEFTIASTDTLTIEGTGRLILVG